MMLQRASKAMPAKAAYFGKAMRPDLDGLSSTMSQQTDQAAGLRALMQPIFPDVIVTVAAHDSVARHEPFLQMAVAAAQSGHELVLLDATPGELAQLLNLRARYELMHLLQGEKQFDEVAQTLPAVEQLRYLSAHRGLRALSESHGGMQSLLQGFSQLQHVPDFVVAHGGPALIPLLASLAVLQGEMTWRVVPRPEVITATYAQLKWVARAYPRLRHRIWLHGAFDGTSADHVFANLAETAQRFLGTNLHYLGYTAPSDQGSELDVMHPAASVSRLARVLFQPAAQGREILTEAQTSDSLLQTL